MNEKVLEYIHGLVEGYFDDNQFFDDTQHLADFLFEECDKRFYPHELFNIDWEEIANEIIEEHPEIIEALW